MAFDYRRLIIGADLVGSNEVSPNLIDSAKLRQRFFPRLASDVTRAFLIGDLEGPVAT
ncbi:MAG TPA: hypothetical protein VNG71_08920 [Pyrinomonadaceae bacterium]|nr:hypothetical protein [Pyrinomonadaceae bacterium]